MSTSVWAHVTNGVCDNIAIFDDSTPMQYFPGFVDIQGLSPMPGIGWRYEDEKWYAPPHPHLTADPENISGDVVSTITYNWEGWPEDTAPSTVDFDVDGTIRTVNVVNNQASTTVAVADSTDGQSITVQCMGLVAMVNVTA